ncbi:LIC11996 family lipoprotein [Leptospira stimsonii]|uniref:Exo-alpha-sialidase n=1 Tax=Leptospira stimsonii TaxID=2202203 RepID=A0ABY2MUU1_9LEPT|nr:hypothetical protein [Leptospira stimsonii]TGK25246.1 hypothetical protein EHO98_02265 [Leptospira stimsonii]TGM08664.1 hypothetical protein EHQ90_21450 [Leptospira stimsonii]
MQRFILMFLIILQSQCYKFEENALDPNGTLGIIRTLLGANLFGYTDFMLNKYQAFQRADIDTYISYSRRTFDGTDDPRNRVDLFIAKENSTAVIPTNVPMVGDQLANLIGYGYIPGNLSNKYMFFFEVLNTLTSPDYYYWVGSVLPSAGSRMNFTKFSPVIPGEMIVGIGSYNVGAAEKIVFCEQPISASSTTCYNMDSDFSNRITISAPINTKCSFVVRNGSSGNCLDSITASNFNFNSTSGTVASFGALPVTLVSNYKGAPFNTFLGSLNFYFEPDLTLSHYVEHTNDSVRITSTPGDITSFGALTSPGTSNQQVLSAPGIRDTDVIYAVRGNNGSYLSFIATDSFGINKYFLFRTTDFGVNWVQINQSNFPIREAFYPQDAGPSNTAAFAHFVTMANGEKLHTFNNVEGDTMRHYVSTDFGTSWTLLETIFPSAE